jgi:iron complex transport system ATP-binding protein
LKNVSCGYGNIEIVHEINFSVRPGEFLCIAGPNGSGKSTLLKAIAKLIPYRGSITLASSAVNSAPSAVEISSLSRRELARKVALLAQSSRVYFSYSVYDTVAAGRYAWFKGRFSGLSPEDKAVIKQVMEQLDLEPLRDAMIDRLSGGQLQRVFLARTIVQEPDIILLDEPTNSLDIRHQLELLDYLKKWVKERADNGEPRALIAVLHDLNLVQRYADRAALIKEGKLTAFGEKAEVLTRDKLLDVYASDVAGYMKESLALWS